MTNTMTRTLGILTVLLGMGVGCGGGPISSGGLGPFSPDKFPPVEITAGGRGRRLGDAPERIVLNA
ncbi:MAG: hypothetical protein KTR15_01920 [Phycisphaeraceae bacterium]|nr:hypothetical protein [Phycisphaeraceae bacterium]